MLIITDKKKLLEYREKRHWLEWNSRNHSHFNRLEDRRQNKHIKTSSEHDGKQKPSIFSEILQKFKEILFLKKKEKGKKTGQRIHYLHTSSTSNTEGSALGWRKISQNVSIELKERNENNWRRVNIREHWLKQQW